MIPKRAFWFAVGAAAGAAVTLRAQQEIADPDDRQRPGKVAKVAAEMGREKLGEVRDRISGP